MSKDTATLTMAKNYALINLIKSEYAESGINDVEFAKYATDTLQVPVNNNHIAKRRYEFGIPSNVVKVAGTNVINNNVESRLTGIEEDIRNIQSLLMRMPLTIQ